MGTRSAALDAGVSVSFVVSAVIHLAVFLLLLWSGRLFPPRMLIEETYYVDVVTLPAADPQSGSPVQNHDAGGAAAPASLPPATVVPVPAKAAVKPSAVPVRPAAQNGSPGTESAFSERMAKLERTSEARREEAVLEKLRSKVKAGTAKSGTPDASGAEAASRYADYVKSRLEDALKMTSSYTTKNPEVAVRLAISTEGRLLWRKIERSSGDATFQLAVERAIDLASEKFTVPPGRTVFENGFVFKPKGISSGTSR